MNDTRLELSPIVLFVYNRLDHTIKTIEALQKNTLAKDSVLYIFSDGPKSKLNEDEIFQVREYLNNITGFKEIYVVKQEANLGLACSIILGVTKVIEKYGKVIVLEDDLITTPDFLTFMNHSLDILEQDQRIWSVTGYSYPIEIPSDFKQTGYLFIRPSSWGWGTWFDRWQGIDWDIVDYESFKNDRKKLKEFNKGGEDLSDMLAAQKSGEIDSWAVRWAYAAYKQNKLSAHPRMSKVLNIGFDGTGAHCGSSDKFDVILSENQSTIDDQCSFVYHDEISSSIHAIYQRDVPHKIWAHISKILDYLHLGRFKRKLKRTIKLLLK